MRRLTVILMMFVIAFSFAITKETKLNTDLETLCHNRVEGWSLYIDNDTGVIYHQYRSGNRFITDAYPVDHPQHDTIVNEVCGG